MTEEKDDTAELKREMAVSAMQQRLFTLVHDGVAAVAEAMRTLEGLRADVRECTSAVAAAQNAAAAAPGPRAARYDPSDAFRERITAAVSRRDQQELLRALEGLTRDQFYELERDPAALFDPLMKMAASVVFHRDQCSQAALLRALVLTCEGWAVPELRRRMLRAQWLPDLALRMRVLLPSFGDTQHLSAAELAELCASIEYELGAGGRGPAAAPTPSRFAGL